MEKRAADILTVRGLRKEFGKITALDGIDISIDSPGVYGFLGPNGAGKTTTFKIISGLLSATAGSVSVCGIDVASDAPSAMENLGVLFDSPAYYPYLTGRENLEVFARWAGGGSRSRIGELLSLVGLENASGRKAGEYSWGMKRRLGIASALLSNPVFMLMDEPTNGLDPAGIADIRRLLPRLAYEQKRAVLLSSHRMEEVEQTCDHVTIIHMGRIVASGTPAELSKSHPVIEIECSEAQRAKEILSGRPEIESVEQTGAERIRVNSSGMSAASINALLVGEGIGVQEIARKRESLEEIFFRLTGGVGDGR